ncbi:hypothetical protein [Bacteroides pyogenes]|nr:hypothetical protein [Bacteroides pyogenes]MDY5353383.1 hypothetical protein [Bacteroides pyogenes]
MEGLYCEESRPGEVNLPMERADKVVWGMNGWGEADRRDRQ